MTNALLDPIEVDEIDLGTLVDSGTGATEGEVRFWFTNPTSRLRVVVEVGWFPFERDDELATSTWELFPLSKTKAGTFELKDVVGAGTDLPDSYEAETGLKEFIAVCSFVRTGDTVERNKRLIATVRWEPKLPMNGEERSYWIAKCQAKRISELVTLGPSE